MGFTSMLGIPILDAKNVPDAFIYYIPMFKNLASNTFFFFFCNIGSQNKALAKFRCLNRCLYFEQYKSNCTLLPPTSGFYVFFMG